MKKNLFFALSFFVSCVLTMTSCSQDLDYKKACEEKDFAKAYEIVDVLREQMSDAKIKYEKDPYYEHGNGAKFENAAKKYMEAERYVVLQEAIYVLESNGAEGLMRIVGIAKEHNAEEWLYSELLDVANKIGDTDLAERIQNIIKSEKKKGSMMQDSEDLDIDMKSMMDTEE